jgi:hypothetical protein
VKLQVTVSSSLFHTAVETGVWSVSLKMDKIEYHAVIKFFVKEGLMANEKRPGLQKKKIIFHQDNTPAHKSVLAMGNLRDLHYELLEHPPDSPDLVPSDFYLFPKLKTLPRWSAFFFKSRRLQL